MAIRKNTTTLLAKLRQLMKDASYVKEPLNAYIVPWADAHNSEYLAECDQQRAFISGFTGSAGTAVITDTDARLWTDGRYYLQASQELDSNWTLMKESLPSTPTQAAWLCKNLPQGSRVGANPYVMALSKWRPLQEQLQQAGHRLVAVEKDLVASMWTDRPQRPCNPVKVLPLSFSGKTTADKLVEVRKTMNENSVATLVITALDEVAWLLNMRGTDIQFNPVFFAYIIITENCLMLFTDRARLGAEAADYLACECGAVSIHPYEDIKACLTELATDSKNGKIWVSNGAPFALASVVPEKMLLNQVTPVELMKAIKNPTEVAGMRYSHERDGAALCCFFAWLEREIESGSNNITEISAADQLDKFRAEQANYMGPSFETISSSGKHGAIIHYKPTKDTDAQITNDLLYLCDSGGQYLDGTTDVTRTLHFGCPTEREKECFTRVLKGQLALAAAIFPERIKGNCLDSFARKFLWDVGLDYAHGTGHGIGHYLNVHEGPMGVSWRVYPDDPGMQAGMFISNEPGYYEDGKFGIRLENIVQVVDANVPPENKVDGRKFLTFETVTMCPIQTKMICRKLLTENEIAAINSYHKEVREKLTPLLAGKPDVLQWLERETKPI